VKYPETRLDFLLDDDFYVKLLSNPFIPKIWAFNSGNFIF